MSQHKVLEGQFKLGSHDGQPDDLKLQFDLIFKQLSERYRTTLSTVELALPETDGVQDAAGMGGPASDGDDRLPFPVVLSFYERSGETQMGRVGAKLKALFRRLVDAAAKLPGPVGIGASVVDFLDNLLTSEPSAPEAVAAKDLPLDEIGASDWPRMQKLFGQWTGEFRELPLHDLTEERWREFVTRLKEKTADPSPPSAAPSPPPSPPPPAAPPPSDPKPPLSPFALNQLMGWLTVQRKDGEPEYGFRIEGMTRFPDDGVQYGGWARLDVIGPDGSQLLTKHVDRKTLGFWLYGQGSDDLEVEIASTKELRAALASPAAQPQAVSTVNGRLWFSDGQPFGVRTLAVFVPPKVSHLVDDCSAPEELDLGGCGDEQARDLLQVPQALAVTQTDPAGYFEFSYTGARALPSRFALFQVSGLAMPLALELLHGKAKDGGQSGQAVEATFPKPVLLEVSSSLILPSPESRTIDWLDNEGGGDCGCRGLDFGEPNRALDEFKMDIVVRTTDPMIVRARLDAGGPQLIDAAEGNGASGVSAMLPTESSINRNFRVPVSRLDPVEWDSAPLFAQAVTISHGRVLTIRQVWRSDGYSLGDLRYSLPLAPLQKKNIAVIDWDRRDTLQMESTQEYSESLYNFVGRERDISEIVNSAVAETINARSDAGSSSRSAGGGFSLGPLAFGGASGGSSGSWSSSSQQSSRSLAASFMNQLRDQTVQSANALRAQRVTTVQQVNQTETARAVTETVANRNACHAITVQYFEVLRHFRVDHELAAVRECLYIPLPISAFNTSKALRWRRALDQYLPSRELRDALGSCQQLLDNAYPNDRTYADDPIGALSGEIELVLDFPLPPTKLESTTEWKKYLGIDFPSPSPLPGLIEKLKQVSEDSRSEFFEANIAPVLARKLVSSLKFVADVDGSRRELPLQTSLVSTYRPGTLHKVRVSERESVAELQIVRKKLKAITLESEVAVPEFFGVIVSGATFALATEHMRTTLIAGRPSESAIVGKSKVELATPPSPKELRDRKADDEQRARMLLAYLNENVEYYHKAIWWTMDSDRRFALLDGFVAPNAGGRSVASVVENRLVAIIGNCLVMPVAPGTRLDYFDDGMGSAGASEPERGAEDWLLARYRPLIPNASTSIAVPTKGVFAESVMGSCNSCEKIDNSRNWQYWQHPLPDEPTAIEPLSLSSRARDTSVAPPPSMLTTPTVINQVATSVPPAPDPIGLAAAIAAVANGGMFRDATGLAGTQQGARDALAQSYGVTTRFGELGAELSKKTIDASVEAMKMVVSAYTGMPMMGGGTTTPESASQVKEIIGKDAAAGRITTEQAQEAFAKVNDRLVESVAPSGAKGLLDHPEVSSAIGAAAERGAPLTMSRGDSRVEVGEAPKVPAPAVESRLPWPLRLLRPSSASAAVPEISPRTSPAPFSFDELRAAYPGKTVSAEALAKKLGGEWPWRISHPDTKDNWSNTCAVRLSVALKGVGVKIPRSFREGMEGDGSPLIYTVETMDRFLKQILGEPRPIAKAPGQAVQPPPLTGIIIYRKKFKDATGHLDLWDGSDFIGAGNRGHMTNSDFVGLWPLP